MKCRCCGQDLPYKPLISYNNMPKSAQFFPDSKTVKSERGVDLTLYHCRFCGMIQLDGEPVSYFREVIRAAGVSAEMTGFRLSQFSDWLERFGLRGKKILEVGCGYGEYMSIMERAGGLVTGIEKGCLAAEKARLAGHKVYEIFMEDESVSVPDGPYDAFYVLNFLEHIPFPGNFIRGIANNLTDGACGLVEVPNLDMILRENLYSELIQDHLLYFTADTLCRILSWNGFEVLSCRPVWHDYILSAEVRRRRSVDVSGFVNKRQAMQKSVSDWLKEAEHRGLKTAVWGAGHQALANLSLLGISDRLEVVIDSADFKQNKYTPATHIPIVAPSVLKEGKIGAVLIMAAAYSEEIAKIIHRDYPEVSCAVLTEDGVQRISAGKRTADGERKP